MIVTFETKFSKDQNEQFHNRIENTQKAYVDYVSGKSDAFPKLTELLRLKDKAKELSCKNFCNCLFGYEDFYNELIVCLLNCIEKYSPKKMVYFYAYYRVAQKNHIITVLNKRKRIEPQYKKIMSMQSLFNLDEKENEKTKIFKDVSLSDPALIFEKKEMARQINNAILKLRETDRDVFLRITGYGPYDYPQPVTSIMAFKKISSPKVNRILERSKKKLRFLLRDINVS